MKQILVIDNYDSFTYNLVHMLNIYKNYNVEVKRNDAIDTKTAAKYDKLILSPGPGVPEEAGNMPKILHSLSSKMPILGVCLGHQAITEEYGGSLRNLSKVYHGIEGEMIKTKIDCPLLKDMPETFMAGRYHSWVADQSDFPKELMITSVDNKGEIMSLRHRSLPLYGVQFHPESIMTPLGKTMIKNFMEL
ncbi:MAG: aminodeoxychorismate/anthranilate synthase component II [Saprospiraceae bacterium]